MLDLRINTVSALSFKTLSLHFIRPWYSFLFYHSFIYASLEIASILNNMHFKKNLINNAWWFHYLNKSLLSIISDMENTAQSFLKCFQIPTSSMLYICYTWNWKHKHWNPHKSRCKAIFRAHRSCRTGPWSTHAQRAWTFLRHPGKIFAVFACLQKKGPFFCNV